MNKRSFLLVLFLGLFATCKNKSQDAGTDSGFFPVLSYLQSQARQVDTSVYSIVQITRRAGRHDTAYIRREDFKSAAKEFLTLPDIAAKQLRKKYIETKLYDEDLKKVVITYAPKEANDFEKITRQDVLIEPDAGAGDHVQTIYIETVLNKGDSTVQKRLTWNVDRSFQVITIVNKKEQPETVVTTDVTWSNQP